LACVVSQQSSAGPAKGATSTAIQQVRHHTRPLFWIWLILVAILAGAAIILGANAPHFWLWWEAGALLITTCYTLVFYIGLFVRQDEDGNRLYEGIEALIGIVPIACAFAVIFLSCSTLVSIIEASDVAWYGLVITRLSWLPNPHVVPIIFLVFAASCFCFVDLIFRHNHINEKVKQEFGRALYFNGFPVLVAFFLLFVFVYRFENLPEWSDSLRSFIGGAVAFETLVSNTMFAILFFDPKV
jgi:hypothetical protein